ncbi:MAG: hypothetical protein NTW01_05450 [Gammaproteobacteria bacterium]|jgi:hypothetical protein|nr:hypothetical protein [Gammaproteobacteria bacterium]
MPKVYDLKSDVLLLPDRLRAQRLPLPNEVLPDGCYRLRWLGVGTERFEGSLRVHRLANGVPDVSGDLYEEDPGALPYQAGDEIPVYARDRYRYYLQFTRVSALPDHESGVELGFIRVQREPPKSLSGRAVWREDRAFFVNLRRVGDNSSYVGDVFEGTDYVASLHLVWVSRWLRAATIEIDHEQGSAVPVGNGDRIGWATLGASVDWQFTRLRPQQVIPARADAAPWTDAALHEAMLSWRDRDARLDQEWRYHLLCVGRLKDQERGLMYDVNASDSNVVREGAAIASNWVFPNTSEWGALGGKFFEEVPEAYFRTAVHEIGHAMGLFHDGSCQRFLMRPTDSLADDGKRSGHLFPANIDWTFDEADRLFLRHAPDPLVRPGGDMPPYSLTEGDSGKPWLPQHLQLSARPLQPEFPLGAPVRVELQLTLSPDSDGPACVPVDLSLVGPHVSGCVCRRDHRDGHSFRSLLMRCDRGELRELTPGASNSASLTLLRGREGALFPEPGDYTICVRLDWQDGDRRQRVWSTTTVTITEHRNQKHLDVAQRVLKEPDTLLALVLGGNHLKAGMAAIEAALKNPVLRPHYAWIEAKRRATLPSAGLRQLTAAALLIDVRTVLSQQEREKVEHMFETRLTRLQEWRLGRCLREHKPLTVTGQAMNQMFDALLRSLIVIGQWMVGRWAFRS